MWHYWFRYLDARRACTVEVFADKCSRKRWSFQQILSIDYIPQFKDCEEREADPTAARRMQMHSRSSAKRDKICKHRSRQNFAIKY